MWILFALLNPLSEAFRSFFIKKASYKINPLIIAWSNNLVPVIIFLPILFFIDLRFSYEFWGAFLATGIINVAANVIYMKALAEGDISEVMPMLSFTPLFLLITSPIIVGEFPSIFGLIGVLLIFFGSYLLNSNLRNKSFWEPLKSLLKKKGTRYMLFIAFIWSLSANFDKVSIQYSSIMQHIIFMNILIFLAMTFLVLNKGSFKLSEINHEKKNLFLVSLLMAASFIFHMVALSLTLVVYVVALKRLAGVISVFLGHYYLKELNIKERLIGSIVMLLGLAFILFS